MRSDVTASEVGDLGRDEALRRRCGLYVRVMMGIIEDTRYRPYIDRCVGHNSGGSHCARMTSP